MTQLLINGFFFLFCGLFGMYSMYKNDSVVTNRWLFLFGWFLFVSTLASAGINFVKYAIQKGYMKLSLMDNFSESVHASISSYVTGLAYIFFAMYLYSLRKKCMTAELLPRTFRIWLIRNWNRIRYRKAAKVNTQRITLKLKTA